MMTPAPSQPRPTPMDRAPRDPAAPVAGPGQWSAPAPRFAPGEAPAHVALIMDGNGRWANQRGLARTEGHRAGEYALMDTIAGAIDAGVRHLSVYTFSTENWRRSPAEVRFIMGYATDVLARRTAQLDEWGVHVRWSGRRPRLWKSVIGALERAEERTRGNSVLDLVMCVNYGGRAELADAARSIAAEAAAGRLDPARVGERTVARHLYLPDLPDVDLMIRTSGEQRISNYLLWQMAYAEMMFSPVPWPAFDREALWDCLLEYAGRERRFGGAEELVARPGAGGDGS
ncbi:isoprenyl transferase [Actinomyces sp. B33]|uniref:isoprenyl transferase n=1 Tax=Actinomyces sp. B33 TaxID=2942131 RepID=UPI002342556D|nr:isoprenyl transferase [Actinomyces sp. B33]MDC4232736.1 isoprenyl transferase [Actinomyces sp. B33]